MQRIVLTRIGVGEVLSIPVQESAEAGDFLTGQLALALDRHYSAELQTSADGHVWIALRAAVGQGGDDGGGEGGD